MEPSELTDAQLIRLLDEGTAAFGLEYESTGPGKFEGNANPGLAQAIYERSLDTSWLDDETGSVEWRYWVGLLGRFILLEDDRGFVYLEEHSSRDQARIRFDIEANDYAEWCDGND